jgi:hypothetical protein
MKTLTLVVLSLLAAILPSPAQPGAMGTSGPGLSGSTAKLFGDNTSFSADLELQVTSGQGGDTMTLPGKIYFDEGKSRFEIDMSQIKGGMMSPQMAMQMKSMGMDKAVVISRPDKKLAYQVYPGLQAYIESQLSDREAALTGTDFKMDTTEMAKETVDGHPCVKNKTVVTEKDGTQHESMVWNATDLKKFPVKIEQAEGGTKTAMQFREVKLSKPSTSLFDPPGDAKKYDNMQAMMQQVMSKAIGGAAAKPQGQ